MSNFTSSAPAKWFKVEALKAGVFAGRADMDRYAAEAAVNCLRDALSRRESASVIFATGNSQIGFLEALKYAGGVDWGRVTAFHMDEYLGLPRDHSASFRRFIRERIEATLHPAKVHYLEGDAFEPIKECDRYAGLLFSSPIDLCCLGIGENGHIAFNDPDVANFEDPQRVKIVRLDEACRNQQVGEGHFPTLDSVPKYALTLTIPMLCASKRMLCIAPEQRKAKAVRAALLGPISTACPASILRRQPQATLLLDPASAQDWLKG